jgi:hypothetical protein
MNMRKIAFTILGAVLVVAGSTAQTAMASEPHVQAADQRMAAR